MSEELVKEKKVYHEPTLTAYGKMTELTQALPGPGTGDDTAGYPSSYSIQSS